MGFINKIKFYYKSFLSFIVVSCSSVVGVFASIILSIVGKKYIAQWATARFFYYMYRTLLGIDVKVTSPQNLENLPCIFVSNHQSALDIMVIGKCFPRNCTVTAKKSLKYVPFLGWYMSLSGTLFLDRKNGASSIVAMKNSLFNVLVQKRALWVFPEGTRCSSEQLEMLPFKKGAFHMAQQGKIPIVPVVVSNTSNLFNKKHSIFNRGNIVVKVLDPISTQDLKSEEVADFANKVQEKMLKELKELGFCETSASIKRTDTTTTEAADDPPETDENEEVEEVSTSNTSPEPPVSEGTEATVVEDKVSQLKSASENSFSTVGNDDSDDTK
ncbi:hypothetical protein TPHA_0B02370 [Tetrapisispora phaffii CBS 4417]|uniref:1-acyl-sn-glycerol-3-phosphate acyltransferase n=1 Tax=Tetrapisispora phaffii (strain ATCC 24235 / CBS 4417 / NBRC 1672 / NRRL Y-8282 / UCD 70-5) TaxID=1071381 RepID=G8BPH9_TETPH|nr:hypothetical protein TPHA_0B02370 [Tetrapisispora phaffii CBS 4417]CCE61910.1 hypothetical protein TPHA_0B02370 [Tetrapisispora phaffii CBS 4417]